MFTIITIVIQPHRKSTVPEHILQLLSNSDQLGAARDLVEWLLELLAVVPAGLATPGPAMTINQPPARP